MNLIERDLSIIYDNYSLIQYDIIDSRLIINDTLYLDNLSVIPDKFLDNSIINGDLWLDNIKVLQKFSLKNTIIKGNLGLETIKYLPKYFSPEVSSIIWLAGLKSKTLKKLIEYPGSERQLGFNLLKI